MKKYCNKQKKKIKTARKQYVFYLYSSIVKLTPVDTGRARGNWQVTVNSPSGEVDEKAKFKRRLRLKSGDDIPTANGDESYFIENNLPYITALEYGRSKQAPQGMVGLTLANSANLLKKAIEDAEVDT